MGNPNRSMADISAVLTNFTYLDIQREEFQGKDLNYIVSVLSKDSRVKDKAELQELKDAIANNDSIGKIVLRDQSNLVSDELGLRDYSLRQKGATDQECKNDYIEAAAWELPDGEMMVTYRGTGEGRWGYNAEGMVHVSPLQESALRYFDYVYEKYPDKKFYVGGHSTGGNEAQYVMLASKYGDSIEECYSIDGQGFSPEAIRQFKEFDTYEERLSRTYSINDWNDPVHNLGIVVVPSSNTYYLYSNSVHELDPMMKNGRLNWPSDGSRGVEGPLSKYTRKTNTVILNQYDDNQRIGIYKSIMYYCEKVLGNDEYANFSAMDHMMVIYGLMDRGVQKIIWPYAYYKRVKNRTVRKRRVAEKSKRKTKKNDEARSSKIASSMQSVDLQLRGSGLINGKTELFQCKKELGIIVSSVNNLSSNIENWMTDNKSIKRNLKRNIEQINNSIIALGKMTDALTKVCNKYNNCENKIINNAG